tara:strand:- start:696 stop:1109 length:414 start_codon:yes stop_codon:yes gene_type:complete
MGIEKLEKPYKSKHFWCLMAAVFVGTIYTKSYIAEVNLVKSKHEAMEMHAYLTSEVAEEDKEKLNTMSIKDAANFGARYQTHYLKAREYARNVAMYTRIFCSDRPEGSENVDAYPSPDLTIEMYVAELDKLQFYCFK